MSATMDNAPLVDAHFHVYTTDLPLAGEAKHRPPEDADTERLIRTLDAHGVLFGVISASSLHGDYRDYMRKALAKHKRLRATAIVRPTIDIGELERMKAEGFVGIRLIWRMLENPPDIDSPEYRVLLRRVADLGWHVHILERPERLHKTIAAVEAAGARVVLDHMGLPNTTGGLDDPSFRTVIEALERGNTWAKISAGYRFNPPEVAGAYARELVRITGGEKLLWASDWPFAGFERKITYADTLTDLRSWVVDDSVRRRIGGRNALEFYFT